MLTIAEVSGLIAAAVMIIQYGLPAALVVILVKYAGTENSAVTWSLVNRTISTTVWPHLFRADAVNMRNVPRAATIPSWTLTGSAALLILSSVLAPLGLYEDIVPGDSKLVEFQYVSDPSPWGRVTMPRPNSKFTRHCEFGLVINCPGQYQGVYMNETSPGSWESVLTDDTSTINLTIPENFTAMFTSATSERGSTISGLFDIQYRRWKWDQWGILDHGQPYVRGISRNIGSLITEERVVLAEGLIIDVRDNPGIGFRNHTIPIALEHGGTWTEDITWMEPVTRCADTNLTVEVIIQNPVDDIYDNQTFYIVDRGAFAGLDATALESPPWIDNQTLDLFGRAHKAARMHNVLVASSLNISLPIDQSTQILPKIPVEGENDDSPYMYSISNFDAMVSGEISGVGGAPPEILEYSGNTSVPFVNHYPDGMVKLLALNYSAITQICRGYYAVRSSDNDLRANNITYPAVQCGYVLSAALKAPSENITGSSYTGVEAFQRNLYVCASSVRASIKSVEFRYNGTGGDFSNLEVLQIADKVYPDEESKPLWAVEHSYDKVMRFEPLWGIVDRRYETMDGFYSLRAEKLWLPTNPHLTFNFASTEGYDALAAASGFARRLGNLYTGTLDTPDYSGKYDFTLLERFRRLSQDETRASQIPSLMMTDGLAASLVGTKTAITSKYVEWPATLAVDGTARGFPQASVTEYKRVIRYDIRYAIPGFIVLAILLLASIWACAILLSSPSIFRTMQNMYNQTSTGRLATNLLNPGRSDPTQPSHEWVTGDGALLLSFGQIVSPAKEYFCNILEGSREVKGDLKSDVVGAIEDNGTLVTATPKHDEK